MAWIPRIPEIKTANGLTDSQFGLVLVASSVGAVLGAQLSGRVIHRFGSRPVMYFSAVIVPLGVILIGPSKSNRVAFNWPFRSRPLMGYSPSIEATVKAM
jgi:MFS family permease